MGERGVAGDEIAAEEVGVRVVEEPADVVLRDAPLAARAGGRGDPLAAVAGGSAASSPRCRSSCPSPCIRPFAVCSTATRAAVVRGDAASSGRTSGPPVVLRQNQSLRRLGDQDAVAGERDRARQDAACRGRRCACRTSPSPWVSSRTDDVAHGGLSSPLAVDVGHVAAHLDDPEAAVGVELHRDGIVDERLAGDELEAEAGGDLEGLERLLRREDRRGGDLPGGGGLGLRLALPVAGLEQGARRRRRRSLAQASRSVELSLTSMDG